MNFYDKEISSDPLKKKGLIVALTGKVAYNANTISMNSTLKFPMGSTNLIPLSSNTLDILTKGYEQL